MTVDFDEYSRFAVHFFSRRVSPLLERTSAALPERAIVLDVGCGDGATVWALDARGLLKRTRAVVGVDLSPTRIQRFRRHTGRLGLVSDVGRSAAFRDGCADLVLCTMVLEHVQDDLGLLRELGRLLAPGGRLYLTTVLKLRGAWYFRRGLNGKPALDATHVREYASEVELRALIERAGLKVEAESVTGLAFPLVHPILRLLNSVVPFARASAVIQDHWLLRAAERVVLPIPRYRTIEIVASRGPGR
jgi:SAM-dependent methyltransferase